MPEVTVGRWQELYDRAFPQVYRALVAATLDRDRALDGLHDAFEEGMRHPPSDDTTTSSSPTPAAVTPAATWVASLSAIPSATGGGAPRGPVARRPQDYVLPTECQYVDDGTTQGSATAWKVSCPQGLLSTYLTPSLVAQSWVSCGPKMWSKSPLQIAVFDAVNVSGFTGWLDQRPLSAGSCAYPTAPAGS